MPYIYIHSASLLSLWLRKQIQIPKDVIEAIDERVGGAGATPSVSWQSPATQLWWPGLIGHLAVNYK